MSRRYWADLAERTATTYVSTFLGLLLTSGRWHSMSNIESAAIGAVAAVLATAKGLLGRRIGDRESAGFLPAPKPKEGAGAGQ